MRRLLVPLVAVLMVAGVAAAQKVTLTYLVDNTQTDSGIVQALADAYMQQHPDVTIKVAHDIAEAHPTHLAMVRWQELNGMTNDG